MAAHFFSGHLRNIVPVDYEVLNGPMPKHDGFPMIDGWQQANNIEQGFKVMCWKHIPAADWAHSPPDLSCSIAVSLNGTIEELSQPMVGDGDIVFPNDLVTRAHPNIYAAISALRNLLENHGSTFPGNLLIRHYGNAYRSQDIHRMDGPRLPRD